MKKLILITFLVTGMIFPVNAQSDKSQMLNNLENKQQNDQAVLHSATLKNATRLFSDKNDLTSVIFVIPADSVVTVLNSDSTYLHVTYQDVEGYIYKKDAVIDPRPIVITRTEQPEEQPQNYQQAASPQESRFTYLENKYGTSLASKIIAGKIWKGMTTEMVNDSWGTAQKINRVVSGNTVKQEWIYRNTWLYFENDILVDWGPVNQ